ncbi:MAG: RNA methyltransferase [Bacteroidota bacterium]
MKTEPEKSHRQLSHAEIISNKEERRSQIQNDTSPIILLLDRMNDARNLGAIFRLADAGRVAGIYSFKSSVADLSKVTRVSRQTASQIPYYSLEKLGEVIELTKTYKSIALEYTNQSMVYTSYSDRTPCMLVIGNERNGVSQELLNLCQESLHIPMLGQNSSMNVSTATGIILYHLLGVMGRV